jgi:uncharacterized protein YneF (UPF0154 family)
MYCGHCGAPENKKNTPIAKSIGIMVIGIIVRICIILALLIAFGIFSSMRATNVEVSNSTKIAEEAIELVEELDEVPYFTGFCFGIINSGAE